MTTTVKLPLDVVDQIVGYLASIEEVLGIKNIVRTPEQAAVVAYMLIEMADAR
jgi:hypothetical protein